MAKISHLGFAPLGHLVDSGIGIRFGFMGVIQTLFPMKIALRVSPSLLGGRLIVLVPGSEAFLRSPGLNQGSIDAEVLVTD